MSEHYDNRVKKYTSNQLTNPKRSVIKKFHPAINENYFEKIDTTEKAYWLGFLYADGWFDSPKPGKLRLGLELNIEDEILIDRFIEALGLNPKYKTRLKRDNSFRIRFSCYKINSDLIKLGLISDYNHRKKSRIIELPRLESRELYLAYLLGFFDGDGVQGTTKVVCGSFKFLNQIKDMFRLNSKIGVKSGKGYLKVRNEIVEGKGYEMSLGVNLFNEMLATYPHSLQRKRHLYTREEINRRIRSSKDLPSKMKIQGTKEQLKKELEKEVWKLPLSKIAEDKGVSVNTIKYWCIKFDIKRPPTNYWNTHSY